MSFPGEFLDFATRRDELLAKVQRRGKKLRRRRRALHSTPVVMALLVALVVVRPEGRESQSQLRVTGGGMMANKIVVDDVPGTTATTVAIDRVGSTPTSPPPPPPGHTDPPGSRWTRPATKVAGQGPTAPDPTSGTLPESAPPAAPSTTTPPTPITTPLTPTTATTTTTTPASCIDSFDYACGPFRWQPEPPDPYNNPVVTVSHEPARPRVGEVVTYYITVEDPDSPYTWAASRWSTAPRPGAFGGCRQAYGTWQLPAARAGRGEFTHTESYAKANDYLVYFDAVSWSYTGSEGRPGNPSGTCIDPFKGATIYEYRITVYE